LGRSGARNARHLVPFAVPAGLVELTSTSMLVWGVKDFALCGLCLIIHSSADLVWFAQHRGNVKATSFPVWFGGKYVNLIFISEPERLSRKVSPAQDR
jgi:hypothetical protein